MDMESIIRKSRKKRFYSLGSLYYDRSVGFFCDFYAHRDHIRFDVGYFYWDRHSSTPPATSFIRSTLEAELRTGIIGHTSTSGGKSQFWDIGVFSDFDSIDVVSFNLNPDEVDIDAIREICSNVIFEESPNFEVLDNLVSMVELSK